MSSEGNAAGGKGWGLIGSIVTQLFEATRSETAEQGTDSKDTFRRIAAERLASHLTGVGLPPRIELGISYTSGLTTYYSLDQVWFVTFYKREGGPVGLTPDGIDSEIREKREYGERRLFGVIVEGGLAVLNQFRQQLAEPDFLIFVAPTATLDQIGLVALDAKWDETKPKVNLNKVLYQKLAN